MVQIRRISTSDTFNIAWNNILFDLETILTENHNPCLRGVIRFVCIILSTVFPWVKLKIITIGKKLHSPHLPSKNFRVISKDLFLSNLHYLPLSSSRKDEGFFFSQDFYPVLLWLLVYSDNLKNQ